MKSYGSRTCGLESPSNLAMRLASSGGVGKSWGAVTTRTPVLSDSLSATNGAASCASCSRAGRRASLASSRSRTTRKIRSQSSRSWASRGRAGQGRNLERQGVGQTLLPKSADGVSGHEQWEAGNDRLMIPALGIRTPVTLTPTVAPNSRICIDHHVATHGWTSLRKVLS